jgi:drug/metabolite transporter (DMT)-like permease
VSAIFGAYALDEPITVNLVLGLLLVAIGILVASSTPKETTVRM